MARAKRRDSLTYTYVADLEPDPSGSYTVYDDEAKRLAVKFYPSGTEVWKFIYAVRGQPRSRTRHTTLGGWPDMNVRAARMRGPTSSVA